MLKSMDIIKKEKINNLCKMKIKKKNLWEDIYVYVFKDMHRILFVLYKRATNFLHRFY